MKKVLSSIMLLAAAAMAFSSCNKEELKNNDDQKEGNVVMFHITASTPETKSVFGAKEDNAYPTLWTENKNVAFSRDEEAFVEGTPVLVDGGKTATFDVELPGEATEGTIYAFSPKGVYDSKNPSNNVPGFTGISADHDDVYLLIPSEQTPLANSVDEAAQAIVGSKSYTIDGEGKINLDMSFSHVVAYGKMTITNFAGGKIKSVQIVFPGDVVSGTTSSWYYYAGDKKGTIERLGGKTITLNTDNVVDNVFWFGLAPTEGSEGEMKIVVTDDNNDTYTKTIDLTKKALPFVKGHVSSFTANFNAIEPDKAIVDGNYAIFAKRAEGNFRMMSSDLGTASTPRLQAVDSGLDELPAKIQTKAANIWSVKKSGNAYIISTQDGEQISWTSGNSATLAEQGKLLTIENASEEGAFNVSFLNGSETRMLALNSNANNDYFAFYTGSQRINLNFVPAEPLAPQFFNITVAQCTNGTVTPSKTKAEAGETITLDVVPADGYKLATLTYNGKDIKDTKSFTMPAENVTVSATFEKEYGYSYINEGNAGTNDGITVTGNVNTTASNGNPGNSFACTSASNTTFTFSGFDLTEYSSRSLSMDVKFSYPSTVTTYPKVTVTLSKEGTVIHTDETTMAPTDKVTGYNEYSLKNLPDFDKIELVVTPGTGTSNKGNATTTYGIYIDNVKVLAQ